MDENRKRWNAEHALLADLLEKPEARDQAVALFLKHHAEVHAGCGPAGAWCCEDEVLRGLEDEAWRRIPPGVLHPVAWLLWHTARCEDITLNLLVAGEDQVLARGDWTRKMGIDACHTGNEMTPAEVAAFSAAIDLDALRGYRAAVAAQTRDVVRRVPEGGFRARVEPARAARIWAEGAIEPAAGYLFEYWSTRTVAGLLMMPATRHPMVHLNEIQKLRGKLARKAGKP